MTGKFLARNWSLALAAGFLLTANCLDSASARALCNLDSRSTLYAGNFDGRLDETSADHLRDDRLVIEAAADVSAGPIDFVAALPAVQGFLESRRILLKLDSQFAPLDREFAVELIFPSGTNAEQRRQQHSELKALLGQSPEIKHVEPVYRYAPQGSNDPCLTRQWNLWPQQARGNSPAGPGGIAAPQQSSSRALPKAIIAVIDSGIANIGPDMVTANVLPGLNLLSHDRDVSENCGDYHGTRVASVISTQGVNNGLGARSIAANIAIVPIKDRPTGPCNPTPERSLSAGSREILGNSHFAPTGIAWAVGYEIPNLPRNANPARVVNISSSWEGECSVYLQNAINIARQRNALVVVAAGNHGKDAVLYQPGNCEGVVTVASSDKLGKFSGTLSNYGANVRIMAPGGPLDPGVDAHNIPDGIITAAPGRLINDHGTSFATAHVSAVAALIMLKYPELSAAEVEKYLYSHAVPTDPDCIAKRICGAGLLSAGGL